MRLGSSVKRPVTISANKYRSFIVLSWRLILPFLADLIASRTDQIVKMERKWIGLKGPIILSVWIQKLLMLTQSIRMNQAYPRYLCTVVPFGLNSCTPPKSTARNAAYACDGIGATAVFKMFNSTPSPYAPAWHLRHSFYRNLQRLCLSHIPWCLWICIVSINSYGLGFLIWWLTYASLIWERKKWIRCYYVWLVWCRFALAVVC